MSFSSDIKEKLCREKGRCENCAGAFLSGIFEFAGRESGGGIIFTTENEFAADRVIDLIYDSFGESVKYVRNARACRLFLDADGRAMESVRRWEEKASPCCKRAYARGAFIGSGSVTDPKSAYHLEFASRSEAQADRLKSILESGGISAKITRRRNLRTVYIKDCETIADTLGFMGAAGGGLELFSVQVEKEMRNRVNRRVNCETANTDKTARAASRQILAVRRIKDAGKWDALPESLREIGDLRIEYPDMSLKELGEMTDPPIGKSGVNHRLERIMRFAREL